MQPYHCNLPKKYPTLSCESCAEVEDLVDSGKIPEEFAERRRRPLEFDGSLLQGAMEGRSRVYCRTVGCRV